MSTDLEKCPYCGFRVETPCSEPPPILCATAHEILLAQQAEMDAERKLFEDACYRRYSARKSLGMISNEDGDGTPEALFWKQPNGEYGVLMFNAAWWGWKAAKGLV